MKSIIPWPVLLLILLLSTLEPLTHMWIHHGLPEGSTPTGMHTGDSAIYLHAMASSGNGFHSPFATCHAQHGPDSFRYFAPPHLLLYSAAGVVQRALGVEPFLFLGVLNGLGGALYLLSAYVFLREATPRLAVRAFLLFALPGGLGGMLFLLTGLAGLHAHPEFTSGFLRLACYELVEGQTLSPLLLMPRFYYSAPLALGVCGLTCFLRAAKRGDARWAMAAALCNAAVSAVHFRIGPVLWLLAVLWLLCARVPARAALRLAGLHALGTAAGGACFWGLLQLPPVFTHNALLITAMAMWLVPFLTLTCFHWLVLPRALREGMRALPLPMRYLAAALTGYLLVFSAAYLGYLAYYGNWLRGGDTSAAITVSDPSLAGALAGLLWFHYTRKTDACPAPPDSGDAPVLAWLSMWLLMLLALAPSAFGGGLFLQCTPQRLMVLMALPLALLAAHGLELMGEGSRRILLAVMLSAGACSAVVAALCFQGPLCAAPGKGPFAFLHYEAMRPADAALMERLGPGTVLVPPWRPIAFGEVVSLRPGARVLGGPGAMNLGDQPFDLLQSDIAQFFKDNTGEGFRREFFERWCVDWVYCPDTCPLPEEVLADLSRLPGLEPVAQSGLGRLWRVR